MQKSQCLNCLHYPRQVMGDEIWQLCADDIGKNYFSYMLVNGFIKCPIFHRIEIKNVQ